MNIVFWLIVIVYAVAVWIIMRPVFRIVGKIVTRGLRGIENELNENDYEQEDNE